MKKDSIRFPADPAALRQHAENVLAERPTDVRDLSPEELQSLIQELQVHQIELELQNEELHTAHDELLAARDKYTDLYDFAPVGYFTLDLDGRIWEVNLKGATMLGETRGELLGKHLHKEIARDDQDAFYIHTRRVLETTEPQSCELRMVDAEGRAFHVLLESAAIMDITDQVRQLRTVVSDITERKQAEDKLRKYNERQALLAEAARLLLSSETPERIVQTICEGVMEHLQCQAFFNYLVVEGTRKLRLNAYAGVSRERARGIESLEFGAAVCGCVARDGERLIAEDISHSRDERTELVRSFGIQAYACHPLLYRGHTIGTLSFGTRDRTAFSPEDLELMRAVADLAATAMARRQIEDQLGQARDVAEERALELEEANRELEGFTYSVSHDLRAPVRHLVMFSDLLNRRYSEALDDKGRQFLETISISARNLGTMMDGLLDLSRLGRKAIKKSTVDLSDLVKDLVAGFSREQAGARIDWSLGNLPRVEGDTSMLRLVLANLIDNAVKFSGKQDTPLIEIGCREGEGEYVIFVKDNGAGFDMQYADKLFGVFQRLHNESEFKGSGVGLANVARIVQRHGGRVWAEGTVDQGAVFSFSLPKL